MEKRGTVSNTNLERFTSKFIKTSGCWVWTAAKAGKGPSRPHGRRSCPQNRLANKINLMYNQPFQSLGVSH